MARATDLTEDPNYHYHRLTLDGADLPMFSEVWHAHDYTEKGHTHQIVTTPAFRKVEEEV
jgi:hypothetical protein